MALRPALDLELLRTLLFIAEEGSFTKAAERVGRTQSAVTLQVQKLEGLVGQPLVIRSKGGPVELTPQGRALADAARAMMKLNDEALRAVAAPDAQITLRLGTSAAYIPAYLDATLERFRTQFPEALVEVMEGYSCQLVPPLRDGAFDLAVVQKSFEPPGWPTIEVWRQPLRWITAANAAAHLQDPLPLSLSPANCPWLPPWLDDCLWRSVALRALKAAGRPHRVVAAATTREGLYAPVIAGRAVTMTPAFDLPAPLRALEPGEGLPDLPDDAVVIIKGPRAQQPHADALAEIIRDSFAF